MGNPQLSRADVMSQGERACCCSVQDESGWEASSPRAPGVGPARRHQARRGAGKEIKGPTGEVGRGAQGVPLQGPRVGPTQPRSPAPHLRLQGMPYPSTKSPKQSLASPGQEDEVGEVRGFF